MAVLSLIVQARHYGLCAASNLLISRWVVLQPWSWLCLIIYTNRRASFTDFQLQLAWNFGFVLLQWCRGFKSWPGLADEIPKRCRNSCPHLPGYFRSKTLYVAWTGNPFTANVCFVRPIRLYFPVSFGLRDQVFLGHFTNAPCDPLRIIWLLYLRKMPGWNTWRSSVHFAKRLCMFFAGKQQRAMRLRAALLVQTRSFSCSYPAIPLVFFNLF